MTGKDHVGVLVYREVTLRCSSCIWCSTVSSTVAPCRIEFLCAHKDLVNFQMAEIRKLAH
jgi:hypothetical protein